MTEWNFAGRAIEDAAQRVEYASSRFLQTALDDNHNLTNDLHREIQESMEAQEKGRQQNLIIDIIGKQGSGKSIVAMELDFLCAHYSKTHPTLKDFIFSPGEGNTRIRDGFKLGTTLVYDEDKRFRTGLGAVRENEQRDFVQQIARISGLNLISCSVPGVANLSMFTLRAFDIDRTKKVNRCVVYSCDMGYPIPIGHVLLSKDLIPKGFEAKYVDKKESFVKDVLQGKFHGGTDYEAISQSFIKENALESDFKISKEILETMVRRHCNKKKLSLAVSEIREISNLVRVWKWECRRKDDDKNTEDATGSKAEAND